MRYVIRLAVVLWSVVAGLQLAPASAEKRVALVVGNGSYAHIAGLPNVANDAAAMAAVFKAAKFDAVDVRHNLGVAELRRTLREFAGRAADADVAVLFYAGHGIEVGQVNYLIPVDARLITDYDVEDETVALDRVLQAMEPAKRLRLVLLDACRENPFAKSMKRTVAARSVGRGLGRVEPSITNTLIAFATKPNAIAEDGRGPNSPFTAALVKHLLTPDLDLRIALGHVRDEVLKSTASRQEPYVTGSLGGGIVSIAGDAARPSLHSSEDALAWAVVKDTASIPELEAFVGRFGDTYYGDLARVRIAELKEKQAGEAARRKAEWESLMANAMAKAAQHAREENRRIAQEAAQAEVELKRAYAATTPGRTFRDCSDCPEMVVIQRGEFMMGTSASEKDYVPREGPRHRVTLARSFALGKNEVTFAEWDACVDAGACRHRPEDRGWGRGSQPVIGVSWNDVTGDYLPWLSRRVGKNYRLPSEAEWEYAARATTTTPYWWGNLFARNFSHRSSGPLIWVGVDSDPSPTMPVGAKTRDINPWGLHHMAGNVPEWVQDCWNDHYLGAPADGSAWLTGNCAERVARGGSEARPAARETFSDPRKSVIGFRVARDLE